MRNDRSQATSLRIFNAARRRAFIQDVLAELSGRREDLLSFQQVREQLHLQEPTDDAHLEEIPIDRIVGSVGRYRDFNRAFLPRDPIDAQRWTHIARLNSQARLPPISVFQVGNVYFVQDGNHRVSVARARQQKTILAKVIPIPVRVPLGPETLAQDLLLKADYADFLEKTALDEVYSDRHIELTGPGSYYRLLQHIEVHQFYMGLRSRDYPSLPQAAANWYHEVYLPVVERIRASGILSQFPGRTEADLYLWITENRARLQMRYVISEEADRAVEDFRQEHGTRGLLHRLRRPFQRLLGRRGRRKREPSS